jgi:Fic family protein
MTPSTHRFIWQQDAWPDLKWDTARLLSPLSRARSAQGRLLGMAHALGLDLGLEVQVDALTREALTTAAIEGERLSPESVRSSVARRLGLKSVGLRKVNRDVEGLVDVLVDATRHHDKPLTPERLKGWQRALFPTGYSGLHRLRVGRWRAAGVPMRVVSGPLGRETVHFEAPPAERLDDELRRFLAWWRSSAGTVDGLLRAGLAHLWFVTLHPFEDGNGRVGRAITEMALAQDEGAGVRLYSLSAQVSDERAGYYAALEAAQRGRGEVTGWLVWFLHCFERAVVGSQGTIELALEKASFWQRHRDVTLNERQRKAVNRLLDAGRGGFEGGLNTRKYVGMTRASRATAQRELADLVERKLLHQRPGGGRSSSYELAWADTGKKG